MLGKIHSFETMGALDGPGIRFIVFMQGCPLRCIYCHNPDTWNITLGEEMDSDEIVRRAKRFSSYFRLKGGVTLSGGEPLQQAEFCKDIFMKLKENKIHTALDTSGCIFNENVRQLLEYTDLVILDIKHADPTKFKEITGQEIQNTLSFFEYVAKINVPLWIRQVIVPGLNDSYEDMVELSKLIRGIKAIERVELLPYHVMGVKKWSELGIEYKLTSVEEPTLEKMDFLKEVLRTHGIPIF